MFMVRRATGVPNDIARLPGARFVTMSETEDGAQLAEARFKEMTGGDRVTTRHMRAEWFEFTPVAKFWLATNHRPEVRSNSEAIWRRLRLIPFEVEIAESKRDPRLAEKLWLEREGILAWAVDGMRPVASHGPRRARCRHSGHSRLPGGHGCDREFIADCCDEAPDLVVTKKDLFEGYAVWAQEHGIRLPMMQAKFSRAVADRRGSLARSCMAESAVSSDRPPWPEYATGEAAMSDPKVPRSAPPACRSAPGRFACVSGDCPRPWGTWGTTCGITRVPESSYGVNADSARKVPHLPIPHLTYTKKGTETCHDEL
jgi:hypothetical protein